MHFVAHALDTPGALERRQAVLSRHRAYLDTAPQRLGVRVLLSGPLTTDDGLTMIGSFFLLDAEDRVAVDALFAGDPMAAADIWTSLEVNAVTIRQNNM